MSRTAWVAVALAALSGAAAAGGFAAPVPSITAAGTGGAGAARDDEAGAAWTNPAALADGGGWRVGLGLVVARPAIEGAAADGTWRADTVASWSTPPHVDVAWSGGRWTAGVAVAVPFGGGVTWPADWAGRFEVVSSQLVVGRVAPFFGARVGRWRLAAGPHVDRGRLQVARRMDFIDVEGEASVDVAGTGVGVHAAAHWHDGAWAVGATYKSRTRLAMTGGADFTTPPEFAGAAPDQPASVTLVVPDRLTLGGRWRRGPWTALADVEVTLWGTYDRLTIDFAEPATADVHRDNRWHTTAAARLGGERALGATTVRAGAAIDPSPAPTATLSPSSPDGLRLSATVGASHRLGALTVDGYAEYLRVVERATTGMETAPARYGGHAVLAGIGVRWQPR